MYSRHSRLAVVVIPAKVGTHYPSLHPRPSYAVAPVFRRLFAQSRHVDVRPPEQPHLRFRQPVQVAVAPTPFHQAGHQHGVLVLGVRRVPVLVCYEVFAAPWSIAPKG